MTSTIKPWILLIDDEIELTNSLKAKLIEEGYQVLVSGECESAARLVKTKKFCCIVIDQKLRGGTGDAIIAEIRQTPDHLNLHTPILFMSAHLSPAFLKKIGNAVDSFLIKPFDRTKFAETVKDLCPLEHWA